MSSAIPDMQQHKEVTIKQDEFQNAFQDYFETEKSTNGAAAQTKNLCLQWHQDPPEMFSTTSSSATSTISSWINLSDPLVLEGQSYTEERCRLLGKLRIANEYICITLEALVMWQYWGRQRQHEGSEGIQENNCHPSNAPEHYALHFKLSASGEFINTEDKTPVQTSKNIASKMKKRLEGDPFIRKLLSCSRTKQQNFTGVSVCEVLIQHKWPSNGSNDLRFDSSSPSVEERVDVSEEALEGIRRAVLSQTECNLTIMEIFISFPWLVTNTTSCGYRYRDRSKMERCSWDRFMSVTAMGVFRTACDRAALRLLEDALFDACEREGEDDIIEDLNLSDVEGVVCIDESQVIDDVNTSNIVRVCNRTEPRRTRKDFLQSKRSKHT